MTGTLVVGGTGLLGSAVVDRVADPLAASRRTGFDFFAPDAGERIAGIDPDRVVLAATVEQADVPRERFDEAVARFVDACEGRRLVYVSSDAVFDGDDGGYRPTDDRSPVDRYGRRLVAFEDAVAGLADAVVLRPSYLYSDDPLDPRLAAAVEALAAESEYERYDDMYRSPAHVADVGDAVASLARGDATGVLHVPGPRLSVYEFHRRALRALGVDTEGLLATSSPPDASLALDRSLHAERFEAATDVIVSSPDEVLSIR